MRLVTGLCSAKWALVGAPGTPPGRKRGWVERPQRGLCLGASPARPCPRQWCGPQHKYESTLGNPLSSWALGAGSESIDQASEVPALLGIQGRCLMEQAGGLKHPPDAPGLPGPQGHPRCAAHAGSCLCHPGHLEMGSALTPIGGGSTAPTPPRLELWPPCGAPRKRGQREWVLGMAWSPPAGFGPMGQC